MFEAICEIVKSAIALVLVVGFLVALPAIVALDFVMTRFF